MTRRITSLLADAGAWYETFEHEPVRTSVEAAQTRTGYALHEGAKALVLRVKRSASDKFFVMLVFPADLQFDKARVKHLLSARDVRFATEAEIAELTGGVEPGGVPPFGHLFGLPVFVDPALFQNERIVFNAGDRRFSVAMRAADYQRLANPRIAPIVSP